MRENTGLSTGLAIAGVVFCWLPVAAALILPSFMLDGDRLTALWYVPAALVPSAVIGGGLLVWAASKAGTRRNIISWSFVAAVGLWVFAVVASQVTGLSSGRVQEGGWESAVVTTFFAAYTLATIVMGAAGTLLIQDLRSEASVTAPEATSEEQQ